MKPMQQELIPPVDETRLLLSGLQIESFDDEMIRLYIKLLLNPTLSDTFQVVELCRRKQHVQLQLNQKISFDEIKNRLKMMPKFYLINVKQVKVPDTVRVSRLSNDCTEEILNLYFSHEKCNGGSLKSVKFFNFENKALIQFEDYRLVEQIMGKTHSICQKEILIEKYYNEIENEFEFEATSNCEIKKVKDDIIDKMKLIISNIPETVAIQHLDFLIKLITDKQEITKITWSLECKDKLLIDFKQEIDTEKVFSRFSQFNNLNTRSIKIEQVFKTKKLYILVKNQPLNNQTKKLNQSSLFDSSEETYSPENIPVTKDLLELYFTNKYRSGSNGYHEIERKSSKHWIVEFKDYETIANILTREHVLDKKPFHIFSYYENFGLPYLVKGLFKLKIRDEKLKYLCDIKKFYDKLNDILSESNARIVKYSSEVLYIEYFDKITLKVTYTERLWRLKCKECIEYFFKFYKYEKLPLTVNQWKMISKNNKIFSNPTELMEYANQQKIIETNETFLIIENIDQIQLIVIGLYTSVNSVVNQIRDLICQLYFTIGNEEKIIKLKGYLNECENLLLIWQANKILDKNISASRHHTIQELLTKSESDRLKLELEYGDLFHDIFDLYYTDENDDENKSFIDCSLGIHEENVIETEHTRIKHTLDEIKLRINDLKQKFYESTL